ncbi:MAG: molybdopterin-dependent oxidoreductase [Bacteroidota bacterium]
MKKSIDRRQFVKTSLQGVAGMGLGALPLLPQGCAVEGQKTVFGACYHDCPDRCSWQVTVEKGKVLSFGANPSNPYTAGKLCNKMVHFPQDVTYHPDRILTPLKRVGAKGSGQFEPIDWEQAIEEVAIKLQAIITKKGGQAILPYSYGGNQGMIQSKSISRRFFAKIGSSQLERTICGSAAVAGVLATNGQTTGVLPEDIVHSRFIILWGTNPVLSNQHLWPLIQQAKAQGAKVVLVDPFVSATAAQVDWHIQPLPGTDVALALGLIHVILQEELEDKDYVKQYTTGIKELRQHVQAYSPQKVATLTGIAESTIIELAKTYAKSSPSLIRVLIGMEHHVNGGAAFRAIAMLPALTGAWRQLGGGLMHMTYELFGQALNWSGIGLPPELAAASKERRWLSMIQLGRILTSKDLEPSVDALIVFNANPAVTTPNQSLVVEGLRRTDLLTIVLEHFRTDTARYADYIFPATSVLENWDVLNSWGTPYLHLNEPAITPLGEAKSNTEFFRLLAKAMGFSEDYLFESDLSMVQKVLDSDHKYMEGITFESLRKTGWAKLNIPQKWMPHAEGNFNTLSGKCQFYAPDIDPPLPDYQPHAYTQQQKKDYPFHLLTIKNTKNFLNSSHANVDYLLRKEGPPSLEMNAKDAQVKSIRTGDIVRVFNKKGSLQVRVQISKKVRRGVVCLPQGHWSVLQADQRSANVLTPDLLTDMGRGGAMQEAKVNVEKFKIKKLPTLLSKIPKVSKLPEVDCAKNWD